MEKIAGTAFIKIDGGQVSLGESLTIGFGGVKREAAKGLAGIEGFIETIEVPFIEAEIFVTNKTDIAKIQGVTNSSVTAELATGRTLVLTDAFFVGPVELDAAAGKTTIRFEGAKLEPTNASPVT